MRYGHRWRGAAAPRPGLPYFDDDGSGEMGMYYRPSIEVARKKASVAWDRRRSASISRPGSWLGEPWVGDKTGGAGWDSIELGIKPRAADGHGIGRGAR